MTISILLPALSPSMERGNIVRWLKREGEVVKVGDVIAEIETDKATMEIEAFDDGVLSRIIRPEGSRDVAVHDLIGELEGERAASVRMSNATELKQRDPKPVADRWTGPSDRDANADGRQFASPLARRIAREEGVDLTGLIGSGPRGRIVRRDVEKRAKSAPAGSAAQDPVRPADISDADLVMRLFEPGSYEEVALDGMRRAIASRVVEAKSTIPHFYLSADCRADALLRLRGGLNAASPRPGDARLTVTDLIVKALALAMRAVPEANVVWAEDRLLRFKQCDLAVAVAVEGGIYMPIVRNADVRTVSSISAEIKGFAVRARSGSLTPRECQGGSASISNLGMYGVSNFQPIISPPHAFILGIGAVEERLTSGNRQPISVHAFTVTMSCDHRAMDGVLGARLLAQFKAIIEEPMRILV